MKTKNKKKYNFNVNLVEIKDRKSLTSVTKQGQLIVTDMGEVIYIAGTSFKDLGEPMKVVHFLISKEGAKNLVKHLNEILEEK